MLAKAWKNKRQLLFTLLMSMLLEFSLFGFGNAEKTGKHCPDPGFQMCPNDCSCCATPSDTVLSSIVEDYTAKPSLNVLQCSNVETYPSNLTLPADAVLLNNNDISKLNRTQLSISSNATEFQLVILFLKNNKIDEIDSEFFKDFRKLEILTLQENKISSLDWTRSLKDAPLVFLDLSCNLIETITNNSFEKLTKLKRLNLQHNLIESISLGGLNNLEKLEYLDLASNSLSSNNLSSISFHPKSFSNLKRLTVLSLADNRKLLRLPNFKEIGLGETKIESLNLHGLDHLHTIAPYAFDGLCNLTTLNLSYCGLTDLQFGWPNGGPEKTLQTLDLSYNRLTSIKRHYFVSLNEKIYSPLCIYQFDGAVSDAAEEVRRSTLMAQQNQTSWYKSLSNLSLLSLRGNAALSYLEDNAFIHLPNLQYLFLQNCNITRLILAATDVQYQSDAIMETFPKLKGLWIFNNPLYCDCHVRSVIDESRSFYKPNTYILDSECQKMKRNNSVTEASLFLVDAQSYLYLNKCHVVPDPVKKSRCISFVAVGKVLLNDVRRSYLNCPDEPIVLLVAIIIGPLVFIVAIIFILVCGFFTVTLKRMHKSYSSGHYRLKRSPRDQLDNSQTSANQHSIDKLSKKHPKAHQHNKYLPVESPIFKSHHQTNTVFSNLNTSINNSQFPLLKPFAENPLPTQKLSLRKNSSASSSARKRSTSREQLMELQVYCPEVQRLTFDSDDNHPVTSEDSSDDNDTPTKLQRLTSTDALLPNRQKYVGMPYIDEESQSAEDETEFVILSGQRNSKSYDTPPTTKLDDRPLLVAKKQCDGNANINTDERRRRAMFKPSLRFNDRAYASS